MSQSNTTPFQVIQGEGVKTVEPSLSSQEKPSANTTQTEGSLALALDTAPLKEATPLKDGSTGGENVEKKRGRRRKRTRARARTISIRRLSKTELNRGRLLYPETDYWKPKMRSECKNMDRPCPFVSCKYHLYIDVHPVRGSIKINFPDIDVWEMAETCALDIADRGGITLEEVGEIMNLTRERVRQVETTGLSKLSAVKDMSRFRDYLS